MLQPLDKTITKNVQPGDTILGPEGLERVRMVLGEVAYTEDDRGRVLKARTMPSYGWTVVDRFGVNGYESCYVEPVTVHDIAALPEPSPADICRNPLCPCQDDLALIGLDDNDWNEEEPPIACPECGSTSHSDCGAP
jgi:hypothetical protein